MKWDENNPLDIVIGTSAKVAEDMVHGTAALIKDLSTYHGMYKNMASALRQTITNLKKHAMNKKMVNAETRKKVAHRIKQIGVVIITCEQMASICTDVISDFIDSMHHFDNIPDIKDIVSKIDLPKPEPETPADGPEDEEEKE